MTEVMGIVLLLIGLKYAMGQYLDGLNLRHALSRRHQVPVPYQDFIDLQAYQKSIDYTVTKTRFSRYQAAFDDGLLVVVLLTGFLPLLYTGLTCVLGEGIWGQSLVLIAILALLSLPSLPFDWWSTFRIEQRFGFNKSSIALWLSDKAKGALIGFVFLCPLLALLLYCVESAGEVWWMWGFGLFFSFQVLMVVLYPMFILPLFNQLKPMAAGDLRERLFALAERTGFQAQTILVMDGSKRSGHSNAFFAGFGRFRRIVLYDTLIDQMSVDELEAILAHEIGHYKLGHIPKMIAVSALSTFALFAGLGYLSQSDWLTRAFFFEGAAANAFVPVLLLVLLLSGVVGFWLSPLTSRLSRKHEYEADHFARDAVGSPDPLVQSLRKLHKENLSNLVPHPRYSAFYYSHPTLLEREHSLHNL